MEHEWPVHLPVGAVRFVRPTAQLAQCLHFYRDVLGLAVLAEFRGHDGYDGVVLGLPGNAVHLELVQRIDDARIPEPSPENQLVFYLPHADAVASAAAHLQAHGYVPVIPENPYWSDRGAIEFKDPDAWVVIFAPWVFGAVPSQ
ncbi:MAG: VOC family protein [Pseudonocardiales bacterium]|nr:VOC family protein [Pseudonocardiales bacterium]